MVNTMEHTFYIVDYPRKSDFAEAAIIPVEYDYTRVVKCPQCGERVSGGYWKHPREVVLTRQKTPDFLYAYCDAAPFVLSKKAIEEITQAGLRGIECFEEIESVRFQRKSKKERTVPQYYHVELSRSCMTIDHQKSVIKYGASKDRTPCSVCRQVPATYDFFRSLAFHTDDYEGFDIFQIYELGNTVFLSERFVKFYENSTLTNLHYGPARKHDAWAASYFLDGEENA